MIRRVVAIVLGVIAGGGAVAALEAVSSSLWPVPPGFDPGAPGALDAFVAALPTSAMAFQGAVFGVGAFVGTWVAKRVAGEAHVWEGGAVGGLMLMATVSNFFVFSHPLWMMALSVLSVVLGAFAALRVGRPVLRG